MDNLHKLASLIKQSERGEESLFKKFSTTFLIYITIKHPIKVFREAFDFREEKEKRKKLARHLSGS